MVCLATTLFKKRMFTSVTRLKKNVYLCNTFIKGMFTSVTRLKKECLPL